MGEDPPVELRLYCTCGQKMRIPERKLGEIATCVSCRRRIRIPRREQLAQGATAVYMKERGGPVSPSAAEPFSVTSAEPISASAAESVEEPALEPAYLEFYGFARAPFGEIPDPDVPFESASHKESFAAIDYGVRERKGFIAVLGDAGTGKTTVLRWYLRKARTEKLCAVCLFEPNLNIEDRFARFLQGLGSEVPRGATAAVMVDRLRSALQAKYEAGVNVALILDHAETIPPGMFEQLRMLGNIETLKEKVLQIVLVGRMELEDTLNLHEMRPLRQRIVVQARVKPLTHSESGAYLRHRVVQAGGSFDEVFSRGAVKGLVGRSGGIPRVLNSIADKALEAGCSAKAKPVTAQIVREATQGHEGGSAVSMLRRLGLK